MEQTELIRIAKELAMKNYNNGFDFYVECYEDNDWAELLSERNITTGKELINSMNFQAGLRNDAMANAGCFNSDSDFSQEDNFKPINK